MFKYNYSRRPSRAVKVGGVVIGGDNPVLVQSMTNTDTNDTEASVRQIASIAAAGGALVRLTTQGVREAANLANITARLKELGCDVAISADVHFNPKAAFEAALHCDKVRINPGNFVDAARTFRKLEFTDEEYAAELTRIREAFVPFLEVCRANGTAVRLGVNHGSLSDRIMSRYGDTPEGMVESVMEYLRVAREVGFNDIVISIKASNTVVMVRTVRLLVKAMERENMDFPLHLGVTEAGDAEDGRIKSAVGIGALLHEGIGDTIRVSLSEDPENEIPVALLLRRCMEQRSKATPVAEPQNAPEGDSREYARRAMAAFPEIARRFPLAATGELVDYLKSIEPQHNLSRFDPIIVEGTSSQLGAIAARIDEIVDEGCERPIIISISYDCTDLDELRVRAGADFGALLMSGYGNGIKVVDKHFPPEVLYRLELDILQAARQRFSKTEFISCPSCGRTLFDLQSALKEVKQAVSQLGIKGLKIGVMGCIVNGPGEMADADYGYVGAGPGRVSIYRRKELVLKNIPTAEALPALLCLIKEERGLTTNP